MLIKLFFIRRLVDIIKNQKPLRVAFKSKPFEDFLRCFPRLL
jgi:hypothetical protein